MANTTIIIPVYNQYELLRQCVESIFHYIDDKPPRGFKASAFDQILIIDDYSDPNSRLREYENYLNTLPSVTVILSDEYRVSAHALEHHVTIAQRRNDKEYAKMKKGPHTRGHGFALQTGIELSNTEYCFCIDADSCFLQSSPGMIQEVEQLFKDNEKVMSIGQLAGLMSNEHTIMDHIFRYNMGGREVGLGGCPGSPAFFIRKNDEIRIANKPIHRGWALTAYINEIMQRGLQVMNYPIFSGKKMFHVGGAILLAARFWGDIGKDRTRYGMLKDGEIYGGRRGKNLMCDWYQGRYILRMFTMEYIRYLEEKYSKPFNELQPPINDNLFYTAEREMRPVRI